jgi:hypothetical protein
MGIDMLRKYCSSALALLLFISCALTDKVQEEQIAAIRNFYNVVLSLKNDGIPQNEDIEKLSPFISTSFKNLLLDARKAEDRYYKKTKGTVPPIMEGSLFFSLFEGAHRLISVKNDGKGGHYLIKLEYQNPYGKKEKVEWQDRAIIIRENDQWVVHDLEFLGEWQFGAKGKLSDILRAVIEEDENY